MPLKKPYKADFAWIKHGQHLELAKDEDLHWLKTIEIKHSEQKNKALLLLHGFSSSPIVFRYLIPELSSYDTILAPLLPGHGLSIEAFGQVDRKQWLQKARISCKHLCQNFEQVDVLGLSLGGLLACHLAQEFKLRQIYLLAPALNLHTPTGLLLHLTQFLKRLKFARIRNRGGDTYHPEANELLFRQIPLNSIIEVLELIKEFKFKSWDTPTEVFLGRYDAVVDSEKVIAQLKHLPQVTCHYLENSAHVLPIDGDRAFILQEMIKKVDKR